MGEKVILAIWVDDMIVSSADENMLNKTKNQLKEKMDFKTKFD